ncbi:MAG TPA: HD domain-containing protein [Streptosporangiaceae bacterium]|nr:HD domain-containing protein [Streptosporangiaceae bacterium]
MSEPATAPPPSAQVPPAELPASVREAGLANWIREPLDDAVDRRRRVIVPPAVATMGTGLSGCQGALMAQARGPDALVMMGDNPALPTMPERPALKDFFALRLSKTGTNHMLQSATLAREHGLDEKVIMACLLHDIAIAGLISANHGYWGAQMVAPYVDEEVAWAIQKHEALRYFADEPAGYSYPQAYIEYFGADYRPPAYLCREAEEARKHRWYMTSRLITINDIYSFDPNAVVDFSEFEDVIGRNFRQPAEGLGFDGSPVAHMWRTMIWPNNFL